ncbi:retrotransposon protein [Cucumis melo var. makuwa]|uniref:Retrotransposon protein n=1 Tax=Cucumis melo var. makuwa TaxID=1194695 RepID=A0A5D3E4X9_CUCMM|nr:retrotransposon protein [Cucumis melo var. makuwa]TYK30909.1 retrotransposon protein [Cucumis melo var. makuwa]
MATSSRAPWHVWTKKEEDTLVECLVDLVVMEDGNPTMVRSDKITWHNWATSHFAETFVNVGSNKSGGYEGFDMSDGNEEFPSMYSQDIDMS